MMVFLTAHSPHITGLNISWSEVLDLDLDDRAFLIHKLETIREKEVAAAQRGHRR